MKSRTARTLLVVAIATVAVTGCASKTAGTDSRTINLDNGGTVECVIVGGQSGNASIDCIEASYVGPTQSQMK